VTATYAGIPIAELRDLPDDTRRRLLRHLDAECVQAGLRNGRILTARHTTTQTDLLARLAAEQDPPRVTLARQLALVAETDWRRRTTRHDSRRTA